MSKKGKKYEDAMRRYDRERIYSPTEGFDLVKSLASAKFDETVELAVRLGVEWARVFPTEASFPDHPDEAAVARYLEILHAARAQGLTVMVTATVAAAAIATTPARSPRTMPR